MAPSSAPLPVYDSARLGFSVIAEARSLWMYRHLVTELTSRDIKVRYKRSVLGITWTMLSPLLNMVALTIVFSAVLRQQIDNYPVYLLAGTLFWTFFAQATAHSASLSIDAGEITQRIYVPRSVFVVSAVLVALVNLLLGLVPLLAIILATRFPIHLSWLFLPVPVLIGAIFTAGVALVVFTLASRFVDVREVYLTLLSTWFFMTPIFYVAEIVPEKYRFIVELNPMTHLVGLFRSPLYEGRIPGVAAILLATGLACGTLIAGWIFYSRWRDVA